MGKKTWLLGDTNRDGQVDAKVKLGRDHGPFSEEIWEDRDHNGIFEIHVIVDQHGINVVEIDKDQDGVYDTRATDTDAVDAWNRIISATSGRVPSD